MPGANIKIGANSSEFQKQMKEVTNQLKLMSSECGLASEKAKLFGSQSQKLATSQRELTEKMRAQNQIVRLYKDRIKGINSEIENQKNKQIGLSKQIDDATKKYKESIKTTGKNSEETKKLNTELKKLKESYAQNERSIESSNKQLINATTKMNNTEKAILKNKKALEEVEKSIKNARIDKLSSSFEKVSKKTDELVKNLTPLTAGITAFETASGIASMSFEDGMAKVSTIADTTKVPIEKLKEGIVDLSNKTGQSTTDLNEALYQSISASVDTEKAVGFLDTAVKASVGGFTDTTTAVNGLTTVLNSYGLSADEVDKIANQMLITQNLGKTSFGELASTVGKVTPVANALGIETKELFSSLSVTTAQGLATAESVTALKAAMSNIIKPSKEAQDAAETLGIEFNVSALQSKGWIGFLGDVSNGLRNASPELDSMYNKVSDSINRMAELEKQGKKNTTEFKALKKNIKGYKKELELLANAADSPVSGMAEMFGSVEGLNSILMLTSDQGMKKYQESMKEMGSNTEALNNAYNTMNNTTSKKFKNSLNSLKTSLIGFGDVLSPVIKKVADGITSIANGLSRMGTAQKKIIMGIGSFVVGSTAVLAGVSKVSGALGKVVKGFKDVKEFGSSAYNITKKFGKGSLSCAKSVGKLALNLGKTSLNLVKTASKMTISTARLIAHKTATMMVTGATKAMTLAQAGLNFVMSLNPIVLVIGLLVALGATFVILYKKCDWFRNSVNAIWEAIKSIFKGFSSFLTGAFTTDWTSSFGALGNIFNAFFTNVNNIWSSIKGIFNGIIDFVAGVFTGNWSRAWEGVKGIFGSIMSNLGALIKAPLNSVIGLINMAIDGINSISFTAPDWIPGVGGKHFGASLPKINYLYKGGIVTKPTFLNDNTIAGDAFMGKGNQEEAVIPLDSFYRNLEKIVKSNTSKEQQQVFIVKNYMDSKEISNITYKNVNGEFALASRRRR